MAFANHYRNGCHGIWISLNTRYRCQPLYFAFYEVALHALPIYPIEIKIRKNVRINHFGNERGNILLFGVVAEE